MIKFQIGILVVRYHYIETTVMIITHRGVAGGQRRPVSSGAKEMGARVKAEINNFTPDFD